MSVRLKTGIVGATGYAGSELVRLLSVHPCVSELRLASRRHHGESFASVFPASAPAGEWVFADPASAAFADGLDVIFTATPHAAAMNMVSPWLDSGIRVVDLSADFRIRDVALWERTYEVAHAAPQWIEKAIYALPELCADELANAQLAACPGCYPTAVILGLLPAIRSGAVDLNTLVADCKSGTSGMGREPKVGGLLAECAENFSVYAATGHRHKPEIEQQLSVIAGQAVELVFTPQLLPMSRGMLCTLHFHSRERDIDLHQVYSDAYANEPFVYVEPRDQTPQTRWVRLSNMCRIGVVESLPGRFLVVSVIDNLGKGAASQAVEVFNLMHSLERTLGLDTPVSGYSG